MFANPVHTKSISSHLARTQRQAKYPCMHLIPLFSRSSENVSQPSRNTKARVCRLLAFARALRRSAQNMGLSPFVDTPWNSKAIINCIRERASVRNSAHRTPVQIHPPVCKQTHSKAYIVSVRFPLPTNHLVIDIALQHCSLSSYRTNASERCEQKIEKHVYSKSNQRRYSEHFQMRPKSVTLHIRIRHHRHTS